MPVIFAAGVPYIGTSGGEKRATHRSPSAPRPAAKAGALAGRPHSRMNCPLWGTPQRTARGARLRRSTPCTATIPSLWRPLGI